MFLSHIGVPLPPSPCLKSKSISLGEDEKNYERLEYSNTKKVFFLKTMFAAEPPIRYSHLNKVEGGPLLSDHWNYEWLTTTLPAVKVRSTRHSLHSPPPNTMCVSVVQCHTFTSFIFLKILRIKRNRLSCFKNPLAVSKPYRIKNYHHYSLEFRGGFP